MAREQNRTLSEIVNKIKDRQQNQRYSGKVDSVCKVEKMYFPMKSYSEELDKCVEMLRTRLYLLLEKTDLTILEF